MPKTKTSDELFVVLVTQPVGRKKPWCPSGWFIPVFDRDEATGFAAKPPQYQPIDGIPCAANLFARLRARIQSWEELYPSNWRYSLVFVWTNADKRKEVIFEANASLMKAL